MDWDIADGWIWAVVIIGGPLLIGIFMYVYGQRQRMTRAERMRSEQGARGNWGKERIH